MLRRNRRHKRSSLFLSVILAATAKAFPSELPQEERIQEEKKVVMVADRHDLTHNIARWLELNSLRFKAGGFRAVALECSERELPYIERKAHLELGNLDKAPILLRMNTFYLARIARAFEPFSQVHCVDTPPIVIAGDFSKVAKAFFERELKMARSLMQLLGESGKVVVVAGAFHTLRGNILLISDEGSFSFPSMHSILLSYGLPASSVVVLDPLGITEHFKTFLAITSEEPMNDE